MAAEPLNRRSLLRRASVFAGAGGLRQIGAFDELAVFFAILGVAVALVLAIASANRRPPNNRRVSVLLPRPQKPPAVRAMLDAALTGV